MQTCFHYAGVANHFTGGVIITPDFLDQLNLNGRTTMISTITAIYDIGCFAGAILVCVIGDPLGRKRCVLLGTTIMSIGAIIQIASYNIPEMFVGRLVIDQESAYPLLTKFQNHRRHRKRHQYIYSASLARRNIQSKLERKINRHRDDHEYCWFQSQQLGHLWLLIYRWGGRLACASGSAIPFHLCPLRHCTMVA